MPVHQVTIAIRTRGQGMQEITAQVAAELRKSGYQQGVVSVFCRHTSCSLVLMENADPSARSDIQGWLERLVPTDDPHFTHTFEGADDMPSHIKMALTRTSESIPFAQGEMLLGTWQGLFLWEHRQASHVRTLVLTFIS